MPNVILPNLGIELPNIGSDQDTWGNILNSDLQILDNAVQYDVISKTLSNVDVTLTEAEAASAVINLTGTLTANVNVIVPATPVRVYLVRNQTSGAFTVTVKTAAGTGTAVQQGTSSLVYSDGMNIIQGATSVNGSFAVSGALTVGSINSTPIGATTPSTGAFTTLSATGNVTLGDASADTVTVNGTPSFAAAASFAVGTAALPSITRTGDLNTGLYFPAADTVGVATAGTERLLIDSAGNAGLGVTPSAWGTNFKALSINSGGGTISGSSRGINAVNNAYNNNTNWLYFSTSAAARYEVDGGQHTFFTAPSGTAGNPITFTQAMTLTQGGLLTVGNTQVETGSGVAGLNALNGAPLIYYINSVEAARISTTRNLLVGTALDASGQRLRVADGQIQHDGNQLNVVPGINTTYEFVNRSSGGGFDFYANGGSSGIAARITSAGNLLVGSVTDSGARLKVNPTANEGFEVTTGNLANSTRLFSRNNAGVAVPFEFQATEQRWYNSAGAQNMTLTEAGQLTVGGTSIAALDGVFGIVVGGVSKPNAGVAVESSSSQWMTYTNDSTQSLLFYDSRLNIERTRITPGGYFKASNTGTYTGTGLSASGAYHQFGNNLAASASLVGYHTDTANLDSTAIEARLAARAVGNLYVGNTGGATTYKVLANGEVQNTNNSYGAISDAKLKENIVDAPSYLDRFMQVRFRNFNLKAETGMNTDKQFGVIAQELETVFPGLVDETPDMEEVTRTRTVEVPAVEEVLDEEGNVVTPAQPATTREEEYTESVPTGTVTKSVKYSVLAQMQGKVIQEQQAIIDQQNAVLADLLQRVAALESK